MFTITYACSPGTAHFHIDSERVSSVNVIERMEQIDVDFWHGGIVAADPMGRVVAQIRPNDTSSIRV